MSPAHGVPTGLKGSVLGPFGYKHVAPTELKSGSIPIFQKVFDLLIIAGVSKLVFDHAAKPLHCPASPGGKRQAFALRIAGNIKESVFFPLLCLIQEVYSI